MSNKGFFVEGKQTRKMECQNDWENKDSMRKKRRKDRWFRKKWFMQHIKFNCQLYRGDSKFPRTQELTCSEMGQNNQKFVKSFIRAMDREKKQPLWVWKIIDIETFKSRKRKILDGDIRVESEYQTGI